jgi:hypothetical protein
MKECWRLFPVEHGGTRSDMTGEEKSREKGKLKTALTGVGKRSMAYSSGGIKWWTVTKGKSRLGDSGGLDWESGSCKKT